MLPGPSSEGRWADCPTGDVIAAGSLRRELSFGAAVFIEVSRPRVFSFGFVLGSLRTSLGVDDEEGTVLGDAIAFRTSRFDFPVLDDSDTPEMDMGSVELLPDDPHFIEVVEDADESKLVEGLKGLKPDSVVGVDTGVEPVSFFGLDVAGTLEPFTSESDRCGGPNGLKPAAAAGDGDEALVVEALR